MPHDLAGLVVHRHHAVGVTQGDAGGKIGVAGQKRGQLRLIAMQDEAGARQLGGRIDKTGNHRCRPAISAHGVDRNDDESVGGGLRNLQSLSHDDANRLTRLTPRPRRCRRLWRQP